MDINKNEYVKLMYELMLQIEICGGSIELTKAVTMAGGIMQKLNDDERLAKWEDCPDCNNSGTIAIGDNEHGWEPCQCEFCWTNEKSVFYNEHKLGKKVG